MVPTEDHVVPTLTCSDTLCTQVRGPHAPSKEHGRTWEEEAHLVTESNPEPDEVTGRHRTAAEGECFCVVTKLFICANTSNY